METLVQKLKKIAEIPDYVDLDKMQESRKLTKKYEEHPLMKMAIAGEYSFSKTVDELALRYKGIKFFLPEFRNDEYVRKIDNLNLDEIIYMGSFKNATESRVTPKWFAWISDKLMNPVGAGLLFGTFMALLGGGNGRFDSHTANYAVIFCLGAIPGALIGCLTPTITYQDIHRTKMEANFLDNKIEELYRK